MWWFLVLMGCWGTEERVAAQEEMLRMEMDDHWREGEAARDAIVQGDLDAARAAAGALAERIPVEGVPPDIEPLQAHMGEAARTLAGAEDLTRAARHLGALARTCGACHDQTAGGPQVRAAAPPEAPGLEGAMARHQWAAEKMWLALVEPNETAWDEAVYALSLAPLVPSGTPADSPLPPLATEIELGVHELARSAQAAGSPEVQARHYGEMLVSCAACHLLLRDAEPR